MQKRVLIIKNITHEKPGLISDLLAHHEIRYDIIDLSQNLAFPDIKNYNLLIIINVKQIIHLLR